MGRVLHKLERVLITPRDTKLELVHFDNSPHIQVFVRVILRVGVDGANTLVGLQKFALSYDHT